MSKDYRHRNFDFEFGNDDQNNTKKFDWEGTGRRKNIKSQNRRDRSRKAKEKAKYAAFNH